MIYRDQLQEVRELGVIRTIFRVGWEVRSRLALPLSPYQNRASALGNRELAVAVNRLPFAAADEIAPLIGSYDASVRQALRKSALAVLNGRIRCYGRWDADFGHPVSWHKDPVTGRSWPRRHVRPGLLETSDIGDIKDCWELARAPHFYLGVRAAALFPDLRQQLSHRLAEEIDAFARENPIEESIHWASGQEVAFRLFAWIFAAAGLLSKTAAADRVLGSLADAIVAGAAHIERNISYARMAVYNNHLLSEAVALYGAGLLLPSESRAAGWRALGRRILDNEANAQFYQDGAYIQQSHNYHRVALQDYLWACMFARFGEEGPAPDWLRAMERSLHFLYSHQNPIDGRLPNYGANDGALLGPLSSCDFSDFRPVLQTISLLVRQERLYEPGPWDEEAAWWLGVKALEAPLRRKPRETVSFQPTGHHVLRGRDEATFATFRCGALRDRFSQMDMLHVDVWWKGHNVLVDGGSYRYNAAPEWHAHFMSASSHNTIMVDGHDQMLHYRQFKVLYWTKAEMLLFDDRPSWTLVSGQHFGFQRHAGRAVHRRSVLQLKTGAWIVVDHVTGSGEHDIRLHWLGGDFPWAQSADASGMSLDTPEGPFHIRTFLADGRHAVATVVAGQEPSAGVKPRGWLSRYYGEKVPVPSLVVEQRVLLPVTLVTLLGPDVSQPSVIGKKWAFEFGPQKVTFDVDAGMIENIAVIE